MTQPESPSESLADLKKKVSQQIRRIHPQTALDFQALEKAMDQYEEAQKNKALREWLIYQAPPGVYDLFLKEQQKQLQLMVQRSKYAAGAWGVVCLFMVGLAAYQIYQMWGFIPK
jgi:hypothetical protein